MPDLFIRGAGTYTAHINAGNPIGTMQSIEHTLRALDRAAADEQQQLQRLEKTLTDYQAQAQRPFEHEARLKELLARQAQLNAALDLDKSDAQAAEATTEPDFETAAHPFGSPRYLAAPSQLREEWSQRPSFSFPAHRPAPPCFKFYLKHGNTSRLGGLRPRSNSAMAV